MWLLCCCVAMSNVKRCRRGGRHSCALCSVETFNFVCQMGTLALEHNFLCNCHSLENENFQIFKYVRLIIRSGSL